MTLMAEIPFGLSFGEDGDGYIIRQKAVDGAITVIKFTADDVHALKVTVDLWSDCVLSQHQTRTGGAEPVLAYLVD
jgi:hypothetical protein